MRATSSFVFVDAFAHARATGLSTLIALDKQCLVGFSECMAYASIEKFTTTVTTDFYIRFSFQCRDWEEQGKFLPSVMSQVTSRESSSPVKLRDIHWWFPRSIPLKKGANVALLYGTACEDCILVDCWFWEGDLHVIYVERLMKAHRSRTSFLWESAGLSKYLLFKQFLFWKKGHGIVLVYAFSYMQPRNVQPRYFVDFFVKIFIIS